ncbi:pyridine nucleotide-disulfide oxidoreductase [Iodidimonas muriae]|uniref:Pyridine nucleotide-disulfide oxidoreductase n=1 Tax=Iodidimonas muriae TaxID=261467 RepID=A0ABQ2LE04_9PROT|nr:FAD/NAD(P)-binding oxidoreductase [Iodidimonas muriae]GER07141.1 pyridine nucleotide-disulfide oxidoreductase [Kordiimonadales bacterium JCM 17843]GGO12865.1 pyridine nucleotide-disulfide oxidoreductase [Iodidimonas muriae]
MAQHVVIIGAGQAGCQVASSLANGGFEGTITLLGSERTPPYERPPLSKGYLLGAVSKDQLLLRAEQFYAQKQIDLKTGITATHIDPDSKTVKTSDNARHPYDHLVLATGARVKTLACPGADLQGIHSLRSLEDSIHLRTALEHMQRLVIVGGGYIGLEVASAARRMGKDVCVLEQAPRLMPRTASAPIADFFRRRHEKEGVDILTRSALVSIEGANGRLGAVTLADGRSIKADLLLVGIGVEPETALVQDIGLQTDHGILVNAYGETSAKGIYAAGDCTRFHHPLALEAIRLESVQNAIDQAKAVASAILGSPKAYDAVPWFWSDQYDLKLQSAGLFAPGDEAIPRTAKDGTAISVVHLRNGQLVAVEAINRMKDFVQAKRLIASGARPNKEALADPDIPLKECITN